MAAMCAHDANGIEPIAIENVTIVDVVKGGLIGPRHVLIADGRIAAIEEPVASRVPSSAVAIDGRGLYLIPGLVDMHVHLFNNASHRAPNEWSFPLYLKNGVTAVREMFAEPASMPMVERWRKGVESGELLAPRILAAGAAVRANSIDAAREQVREFKKVGADFVKVFSELREPIWNTVSEEARLQKLPICGHTPAEISLLTAARGGLRSNEHLMQVYEACSKRESQFLAARKGLSGDEITKLRDAQEREVLESFDEATCEGLAAELARTGQVQVPTLVLPKNEARRDRAQFRDDRRWHYLRADEQERWQRILESETNTDEKLAALRWDVSRRIVRTLHAAGVPMLAGTDSPMPLVYPGFALHDEMELLLECGLSAAEALRAATIGPAEFLGLGERYGSVAVGKRADLVLLEANPLEQIGNTRRINAVILGGRLFRRADLDAFAFRDN